MSLSGLLALGSSAMMAQEAGVSVTGRNTANAGTAGYSRESVDLQSQLAAPLMTLSFLALLVIPSLKLSDRGLFDGNKFQFVDLFVETDVPHTS